MGMDSSAPPKLTSRGKGRPGVSALADALFTLSQQRVLALLFGQPDRGFFVTEIIALAGCGRGAVQRELARLAGSGLAIVSRAGNRKYYRANPDSPLFDEIRGIVRKTVGVEESVRNALAPIADRLKLAVLFGSIARRADTAASDIDLLLVSDELTLEAVYGALAPAEELLGRRVNPMLYTSNEFRRRRADKSGFVTRALERPHFVLTGSLDGA
ncbi:MAG: nucleotidyltransferase domain-containing protein [Gammaproteobacteria bacterium]|nr:nucleotidyltransferase domain-containing protein [Gammaproteobacteria bacterium]